MANKEHLDVLKQGSKVWNQWREKHDIQPDFAEADLHEVSLTEAHLYGADLRGADLKGADFKGSDVFMADLSGANLRDATFVGAILRGVDLRRADLRGAFLFYTDLRRANLREANLAGANLREANLSNTDLSRSDMSYASLWGTIFANVDLSQTKGLDLVIHEGPSHISISAIYCSQGNIPEIFLRGAGVPDSFITYAHSLIGHPIDYHTCFISYSNKDEPFAKRLYADLQSNGVRCWFAPEHMKIGDEIWTRIDESIRVYDKLLLVLSQHSIKSTWVKNEVEAAFEKEEQQSTSVLFPIAVDDEIKRTTQTWAASIRRRKHIGDFTRWKQHDDYQQAFERLLRDLKAEERK